MPSPVTPSRHATGSRARTPPKATRLTPAVSLAVGGSLLLTGCAPTEETADVAGTVEVCVGADIGGTNDIEVLQDGEVVASASSMSDDGPIQVGLGLPPGPFTVQFADGTPIGDGEITGGTIVFSVGQGCPLTP